MNYPGDQVTETSKSEFKLDLVTIPDVIKSFDALPTRGEYIELVSDNVLKTAREHPYHPFKAKDVLTFKSEAGRTRHFQGVVRTKDGKHIIFSGGDPRKGVKSAQLFICSCSSHLAQKAPNTARGPIGSNSNYDSASTDKLIGIYKVNRSGNSNWHAGGITLYDNILVVPLEGDGKSSIIRFLDISDINNPTDLGDSATISRPAHKAGTASLIKLPNGKYLCVVWVDSDKDEKSDNHRFGFYLSHTNDLKDGFNLEKNKFKRLPYRARGGEGKKPKYQVIQLFLQEDNSIFALGTENSYGFAPIPSSLGKNRARLYKFTFPGNDITKSDFELNMPQIEVIRDTKEKVFGGGGSRYNFRAGATPYIMDNGMLALYACHHRKSAGGKSLQCTEFYPGFLKPKITTKTEALIEIYDDTDFKDRCLKVRGNRLDKISDYNDITVEGKKFTKKASSIKFQIPVGWNYELYDEPNFTGRKIVLRGDGMLHKIGSIRRPVDTTAYTVPRRFNDKIQSSQFIKS